MAKTSAGRHCAPGHKSVKQRTLFNSASWCLNSTGSSTLSQLLWQQAVSTGRDTHSRFHTCKLLCRKCCCSCTALLCPLQHSCTGDPHNLPYLAYTILPTCMHVQSQLQQRQLQSELQSLLILRGNPVRATERVIGGQHVQLVVPHTSTPMTLMQSRTKKHTTEPQTSFVAAV